VMHGQTNIKTIYHSFNTAHKITYIITVVSKPTNVEILKLARCILYITSIAPGTRVHIIITNRGLN